MVQVRKGPTVRCTPGKIGSPRANHSIRSLNHSLRSTSGRPTGLRPTGGLRTCANALKSSTGTGSNVKVVVRVRPPNKKEEAANVRLAVSVVDDKMLIFDPKEEEADSFFFRGTQQKGRDMLKRQHKHTEFLFDRVFGYESTNQQVFEESTKDIISRVLEGYNCSVFVYGATGAGKTFTMLGTEENPGVMFLTMVNLFRRIEELKTERDIEMAVSYLEVYNENVFDLIAKSSSGNLFLREDANGVIVSGLKVEKINNTSRLFELLAEGNKNRTQHPTDANAESSRSHAVFQVYLKMCDKGSNRKKIVKLSMIDLAGSERGSATNFAGARFKEGSSINKSLLALGNCINKLADGLTHIPYRDSKLTRILKDSLSGNCHTVMIANVSPSYLSFEDTHNTLRYAKRAKLIKSVVKKNIVSVEMHVSQYIKMVDDLKEENARLKAELEKAEAALEVSKSLHIANSGFLTPLQTGAEAEAEASAPLEQTNKLKASPRPDKAAFAALVSELEKIFSEKEELQKRYLQMDSNEKILKFRMQCKERSVARIQQLCETPTNTDEAKFRAGRSLKQFTGQLKSAVGCQERLASQRIELNERLESLRQKAEALGMLEQFLEKTARMDAQFQNVEIKEQLTHLNRVMTLMNKEKDDQDEVMAELSSAFRHYFNLLRGHGHMTDAMQKEHKSLVRRLEGLKSVNWDTNESEEPPPLNNIAKLSLTSTSPLLNGPLNPASPLLTGRNTLSPSSSPLPSPSNAYCSPNLPNLVYRSSTCDIAQFKQDLNLIAVKTPPQIDHEEPALLHESSDDEDFCVTGKFAKCNATFEQLADLDVNVDSIHKIDATISKVDDLLNESTSEQAEKTFDVNRTFDVNADLNKTYDADLKTQTADLNKTYELNEPKQTAETLQSLQSADSAQSVESMKPVLPAESVQPVQSVQSTQSTQSTQSVELIPSKTAAKIETVDMNSTYELVTDAVLPTVEVASKTTGVLNKPKTVTPTYGVGAKNIKSAVPKKPLQENNFTKPKPVPVPQVYKWRQQPSPSTLLKGAPISARTILERKSPLNHVKPKITFGNKENGALRRPATTTPKVPISAGGSRFAATSSSHPKKDEVFTVETIKSWNENVRKGEKVKKIGVSALVLCLNKL